MTTEKPTDKGVLILSGGLDSTTLAYYLTHLSDDNLFPVKKLYALIFYYGQRHRQEIRRAVNTCRHLDIDFKLIDIEFLQDLLPNSTLLNSNMDIPEGHYQEENQKQTVVPHRNMLMLTIAAIWASYLGARYIYYGAHSGDHAIYPDCKPDFVLALNEALARSDYSQVKIKAPFIRMDKSRIVALGLELNVPFENTWTCYKGKELACGVCGSCIERKEAFKKNNAEDPIKYVT